MTVQVQLLSILGPVSVILNWLSLVALQVPPDSGATVMAPVSDRNHTHPAMCQVHLASSCHYPRALASVQYLEILAHARSLKTPCKWAVDFLGNPSLDLPPAWKVLTPAGHSYLTKVESLQRALGTMVSRQRWRHSQSGLPS